MNDIEENFNWDNELVFPGMWVICKNIGKNPIRAESVMQPNGSTIIRFGLDDDVLHAFYGIYTCKPIPLTPDLLEKACGFVMEDGGVYTIVLNDDCRISLTGKGIVVKLSDNFCWISYPMDQVQYLHQLQSLYHSLTGQPLPIDEEKLREVLCL